MSMFKSTKYLLLLLFLVVPTKVHAKNLIVTKTVRQHVIGAISPDDARKFAVVKARQEALAEAGVYIESVAIVKQGQLSQEKILALAAGVLKIEVLQEKTCMDGTIPCLEITAKIEVDSSVLEGRIKKLLADREHLQKYQEAMRRNHRLIAEIHSLEEENARIRESSDEYDELKKSFSEAGVSLDSLSLSMKAIELWEGESFTDSRLALSYLNRAIALDPGFAWIYSLRGAAYFAESQNRLAERDLNMAIELDPTNADAFIARGALRAIEGQSHLAMNDYERAIAIDPDNAMAYYARGLAHYRANSLDNAVADYTRAVELDPYLFEAYGNRGMAYNKLGQKQLAIDDYSMVIELDPGNAVAYNNRGNAYLNSRQIDLAIRDLNKAIELDPTYANAYLNRSIAHIVSNQVEPGCRDARKACELGDCQVLSAVQGKGLCH